MKYERGLPQVQIIVTPHYCKCRYPSSTDDYPTERYLFHTEEHKLWTAEDPAGHIAIGYTAEEAVCNLQFQSNAEPKQRIQA